MVASDNYY